MDIQKGRLTLGMGNRLLNVVTTDLTEAEALLCRLAAEARQRNPRQFEGNTPCVYFKLPYVPPYEKFELLRQLILKVRQNTGLRADFHGVVAIEVNEWLGHEKEEYFTVLLKYLYDHAHIWNTVMVLKNATQSQQQRFAAACACIITPRMQDVSVFGDEQLLTQLLEERFRACKCMICREDSIGLARLLMEKLPREHRSLTVLERTVEDLLMHLDYPVRIRGDQMEEYFSCPTTLLCVLVGQPLLKERSVADERKAV